MKLIANKLPYVTQMLSIYLSVLFYNIVQNYLEAMLLLRGELQFDFNEQLLARNLGIVHEFNVQQNFDDQVQFFYSLP